MSLVKSKNRKEGGDWDPHTREECKTAAILLKGKIGNNYQKSYHILGPMIVLPHTYPKGKVLLYIQRHIQNKHGSY